MAKSARSSSRKAAKTKLRNSVYAPVEQARLERLSQRLRESIAASSSSGAMDVEREESTTTATTPTAATTSRSDAASSGAIQEGEVFDAQGQFFFDLPLPLSLLDEDSSSDESEDDAFYRTLGLFCSDGILGFGDGTNTLQVTL